MFASSMASPRFFGRLSNTGRTQDRPGALLHDRLYPDMFTLLQQVQIACGHAERGISRLAGLEPPARDGKEASLEDLASRVAAAIAYVKSIDPKKMEGVEDRDITFPVGEKQMMITGCGLSVPLLHVEFLFSRDDCLQHPPPQRTGDRQG